MPTDLTHIATDSMLITDVEITGLKKDTEKIIIYGYDWPLNNSGLKKITEKISCENPIRRQLLPLQPYAISQQMTLENAGIILEQLRKDPALEGITFDVIGKDKYIIYAEGKRCQLRHLPPVFIAGPNVKSFSTTDSLRSMLGAPSTIYQKIDGKLLPERKLTLEEFCNLPTCAVDTESMFWEKKIVLEDLSNTEEQIRAFLRQQSVPVPKKGKISKANLVKIVENYFNINLRTAPQFNEQISTAQIAYREKNSKTPEDRITYFHHIIGKTKSFYIDGIMGNIRVDAIKCADSDTLVDKLGKNLTKKGFVVYLTHNGMMHDWVKLGTQGFRINKQKPVIKVKTGFYPRTEINGIFHIDMAVWSQQYYPFTIDNKFATVVKLHIKKPFEKTHSYADQTRNTIEMILGSQDAFMEECHYGTNDTQPYIHIAEEIKPVAYLKGALFNVPVSHLGTSKKTLAKNIYDATHFLEHHKPMRWSAKDGKKYLKFHGHDMFLKIAGFSEGLPQKTSKLFEDAELYYLAPFTRMFHDNKQIQKNLYLNNIFKFLNQKKLAVHPQESSHQSLKEVSQKITPLQRFDLINTIEDGYLLPHILFEEKNDFKNLHPETIIDTYKELITTYRPYNHSENFYCFPKGSSNNSHFKELMKGLGFKIAEGKLLNIAQGSFALYDGSMIYRREIDTKGKQGFKTLYEQELIHDFINAVFEQGPREAIHIITDFYAAMNSQTLDKNKMIFFKEHVTKDYFDYSLPAQQQERIKAYIEFGKMKGESIAYLLLDGATRIPLKDLDTIGNDKIYGPINIAFWKKRMFGELNKNGRALADGTVGRYVAPLAQLYNVRPTKLGRLIEQENFFEQENLFA